MRLHVRNPDKIAKAVTIVTLCVVILWGVISVFFEVRPFWVDEWRIIYNLKFKSATELWGKLAFMQQFPRTYLCLLKGITSSLNYSYFSLRLPSFVIASAMIVAVYKLSMKLYDKAVLSRYLLIMTIVSCGTFTEYYVQIKQYTMDLFLCVIVIWQLLYLLDLGEGKHKSGIVKYTLLCLSFVFASFFSYSYPVVLCPVFLVILIQDIQNWKTKSLELSVVLRQWFPLFVATFCVAVFYFVDVQQLTQDREMHEYWQHLMLNDGFQLADFISHIFHVFGEVGSGFIFFWLFGIIGFAAFLNTAYRSVINIRQGALEQRNLLLLYCVILLIVMIVLHLFGKLPLGEPRLNAFAIPAITIMIISLLGQLKEQAGRIGAAASVVTAILFLGTVGNIYSTVVASFMDSKYERRMKIYRETEHAIELASAKHVPICVTPGVAYPYDKTRNLPFLTTVPGDWVLMTFPAYNVAENILVLPIDDVADIAGISDMLPPGTGEVVVGDGVHYELVRLSKE